MPIRPNDRLKAAVFLGKSVMIAWLYNKFLLRRAVHMVPPHSHEARPKPEQEPE